jgi:hypothetical protein
MSLVTPSVKENGFERRISIGDVVALGEVIGALATIGAGALTAALLTGYSILSRTGPTGAYIDTTDTATNIIAAVAVNGQTPMPGTTFRQRILNTVAFINTYTAGTGVTLAGITAIAASSYRDFLITLTNTTPASIASVATTNGSGVITGMDATETSLVSPGMLVTGTGIGASAVVLSVQPGIGVTVSVVSTATAGLIAATFSPTVTITGIGGGLI